MNAQPRQAGRSDDTTDVAASIPPAADTHRRRRARRWAARHLDQLLGVDPPPIVALEGGYWHSSHMDLGMPERDRVGRQLLTAGWTP